MGWTVEYEFRPRKEFFNDLLREWTSNGHTTTCLRHVYRGAPWKGVLYALWQHTSPDGNVGKYVVVYLIQKRNGEGWGYKDMSHDMHPYYYSCPLSYLEGIDLQSEGAKRWVHNVREYWAARREKRKPEYKHLEV